MFGCGKGAGPGPSRELFMEASHSYGSYGQGYGALGISCPFVDVHWMTLGSSFRDGIYLVSLFSLFADKETGELPKGNEDGKVLCMLSSRSWIFFIQAIQAYDISHPSNQANLNS